MNLTPPPKARPNSHIFISPTPPQNAQPVLPMHRRHSANPINCRPLRSSPLAGPALSSEGFTFGDEMDIEAKPKPSRTSSSPELRSLSFQHPSLNRPGSPQGLAPVSAPSSPSPQTLTFSETTNISKRPSFLGLGRNTSKRKRKSRLHTEVPPVPSPPIPGWALQQIGPDHLTEFETSTPTCGHHNSIDPTSHPPHPHNSPQALSRDPTENWLTTNIYDVTPRFSRLGLASTNVVLPVSAREHRRLSRPSSLASVLSLASNSGTRMTQGSRKNTAGTLTGLGNDSSAFGSQSLPSLSLTRTSSNASSKDGSSNNSITLTPSHSLAPSVASLNEFRDTQRVEEGGKVFTQPGETMAPFDAIASNEIGRGRSLGKSRWSMKSMRIKSSESKPAIRSHSKGMSFLSFGADDTHDTRVPVGKGVTGSAVTLELTIDQPSGTTTDKEQDGAPMGTSQKLKKSGTVKRIWRTLSSVRHRERP